MCTYNRAALLPRAIESVLRQQESDWELIIVNDGSTDSTVEVVQKYVNQNPRITLITQSNHGIGFSRNTGVKVAKGLFITFLDSDDEFAPDHLATRRSILLDYDSVQLLHGGVMVVGNPFVPDKDNPGQTIHIEDCVVGGTFVIRYDVFENVGLFPEVRFADDAMFYANAMSKEITIAKTDYPSYVYYRDTPDSLCNTYLAT